MATVTGTSGNDNLNGTSGNDTLNGLGGNDALVGSAGTDLYDGGSGRDTLDLRATSTGVAVSFVDGTISGGFNGTFVNIERVLAGNGADNLMGGAGAQNLSGRAGSDTFAGGTGNDTLWGGGDADLFVYRETGAEHADSIADFASGSDKIVLDTVVMGTLGASGNFAAGDERFVANSSGTAQEADDRVIYETDTRQIWFDPDGTGVAPRELIATLQSGATLVATDIVVQGQAVAITGTEGNDSLTGTNGNDFIAGLGGDDTIRGLAGDDRLEGQDGRDELFGGEGNDTLLGGNNASFQPNVLDGGPGADSMLGGPGSDVFFVDDAGDIVADGGGGHDAVFSFVSFVAPDGVDQLTLMGSGSINATGNGLNNNVHGNSGANRLEGLGGSDFMHGAEGDDLLLAADGNDSLFGGDGADTLDGGVGIDFIEGGAGSDRLLFSVAPGASNLDSMSDFTAGTDRLVFDGDAYSEIGPSGSFSVNDDRFARFINIGPSPATNVQGFDPEDRVLYDIDTGDLFYDPDGIGGAFAQRFAVLQGAPNLQATDIEVINGTPSGPAGSVIVGSSGSDTLSGTAGNDTLQGLGGNDMLVGSPGSDFYDGGTGTDTLDFRATSTGTSVNFTDGTISGGFSGTFTNMERVLAGNASDTLVGGAGAQTLSGRGGFDVFEGRSGADTLWGGAGEDDFIFRDMGSANADRISDFASGADDIMLDDAAFTAIGAVGDFAAGDARFKANSSGTATDTNDRVVFNTSTGQLYYDADGSGNAAAQLIATVQSGASIAATDIVVI
jgi:Ca2+-binding RTX toxin-like protein